MFMFFFIYFIVYSNYSDFIYEIVLSAVQFIPIYF